MINAAFSYVKFLEKQLINTNQLKAKYKVDIEILIESLKEMRLQGGDEDCEASPSKLKKLVAEKKRAMLASRKLQGKYSP